MATVSVDRVREHTYSVVVADGGGRSVHEVTVRPVDVERYAPGAPAERLIEASFVFLLEREPKEAILSRFDLPAIERYFPEYPREIRRRLSSERQGER